MDDLWFDNLSVGRRFRTAGATLTEAEIIGFARSYDPQAFHLDAETARASHFGGLIASGFQTLALAFRLMLGTGIIGRANLGGAGLDECRWLLPVRAGDTLTVEAEVVEQRPSRSKPDRGAVRFAYRVRNQKDETVLTFFLTHIMLRRPS